MTTIDSGTTAYTGIEDLTVALDDGVLAVTLNRPDSLNSLTAAMLTDVRRRLERAAGDPRVRVVRIGGAGRGFSLGRGDQRRGPRQPRRQRHTGRRARRGQPRIRAIVNLPQAGRRRRAGRGRRRRGIAGAGVRRRIGFGEGVFHAGVHQDRADARRWGVGADRGGGRPHPRDADGAAGRADLGRRGSGGVWSARSTRPTNSTPRSTR